MSDKPFSCPEPGCDYTAKTQGAITQHINKAHSSDPLAAVRNGIGAAAPRPGGAYRATRPMTVAPSGVPSVDFALGVGGVPRGTIVEVYGPAASGKTNMALTFSAYAQSRGQRAGYMDAERALQETYSELVPGLDLAALEYGMPPGVFGEDEEPFDGTGEAALESSRRFIASGQFGVWTVDSVAACTPRAEMKLDIGSSAASAAQARMFRAALRVLVPVVEHTDTVMVFVNHITAIPQVKFGRDWSRPVAAAFDYFASIQLQVAPTISFYDKNDRKIGHRVKVRVMKSKVAAPHAEAEYDLFFREGRVRPEPKKGIKERDVYPGIDIASCWFSVLKEANLIIYAGNSYVHRQTGEKLGSEPEVIERLSNPTDELYLEAHKLTYPEKYASAAA